MGEKSGEGIYHDGTTGTTNGEFAVCGLSVGIEDEGLELAVAADDDLGFVAAGKSLPQEPIHFSGRQLCDIAIIELKKLVIRCEACSIGYGAWSDPVDAPNCITAN